MITSVSEYWDRRKRASSGATTRTRRLPANVGSGARARELQARQRRHEPWLSHFEPLPSSHHRIDQVRQVNLYYSGVNLDSYVNATGPFNLLLVVGRQHWID